MLIDSCNECIKLSSSLQPEGERLQFSFRPIPSRLISRPHRIQHRERGSLQVSMP